MDIGTVIKKERKKRGLTQSDLAIALGTTRERISYWENNLSEPGAKNMIKLMEMLGLTVRDFPTQEATPHMGEPVSAGK